MNTYAVEVTMSPVVDDNWSDLRRVTDVVPGTILIEDAEEPVLVLPVDAESPAKAAVFVEGVASVAGLTIVSGIIGDAPDDDFEPADGGDESAPDLADGFEPRWLVAV